MYRYIRGHGQRSSVEENGPSSTVEQSKRCLYCDVVPNQFSKNTAGLRHFTGDLFISPHGIPEEPVAACSVLVGRLGIGISSSGAPMMAD